MELKRYNIYHGPIFKGKWMKVTKTKSWLVVSSLMVHQMSKLMVNSYVQLTLKQCVFMEGSMSCPCFSALSPNSNPYRLVLYFLLTTYYIFLSDFVKCCRLYNVFGSGASHGIYVQFIAQATVFDNRKIGLLQRVRYRNQICNLFLQCTELKSKASIEGVLLASQTSSSWLPGFCVLTMTPSLWGFCKNG